MASKPTFPIKRARKAAGRRKGGETLLRDGFCFTDVKHMVILVKELINRQLFCMRIIPNRSVVPELSKYIISA